MKKLIAILALLSIMVCAVACSSMPSDPKDAKKNLKNEDYSVETTDDAEEIEYFVEEFGADADGIEDLIVAFDDDEENLVLIAYCEDTKTAKSLYEDLVDFYEGDFEDLIEESDEDIDIDDYKVEKSGKVVIFGHKDMIKAAKG